MALTGRNSGFEFKYEPVQWNGPEGYIIVVPRGNTEAVKTAKILNGYFERLYDTELRITNDSSNETSKEILIGATNRKESNHSLKESELAVSLKNGKLVFDGGHYVTVNSAVERFIRLSPERGSVAVFSDNTDFVSVKPDGYRYVWGDEFEGDEINLSKWCFEKRMGGTENMTVQYTDDVITIGDGHATLRAIAFSDPDDPKIEYKVPYSLCTLGTMNFDYGYAEIRAKVPYEIGVWPSFWATTACNISGRQNMQLHAEIDMFENFGSQELIVANVHKWYDEMDYNKIYNTGSSKRAHNAIPWNDERRPKYTCPNPESINSEYHIYAFEKADKEINFFVDGKKFGSFGITETFDLYPDMSVFQDPVFLIMNNHVFPGKEGNSLIKDNLSALPAEYEIDYCRLYQKPGIGNLYTDETPAVYPGRKGKNK